MDRDPFQPGDVLEDAYRIEARVGAGAMGVVYRAVDTVRGGAVAIKALREDALGDPNAHRLFAREAQIMARLAHPNIAGCYGYGWQAPCPYLVLEWLEGAPLELGDARIASAEALVDVFSVLLRALAYAHARGVVHRDLKPGNVILGASGAESLKLLDFGVSRLIGDERASCTTGLLRDDGGLAASQNSQGASHGAKIVLEGTPRYMAPEAYEGRQSVIGPANDLYAVGVMLFEIISGVKLFDASHHAQVVLQQMKGDIPTCSPRDGLTLRRPPEALLRWILEPEPSLRPQHALDIEDALRAWLRAERRTSTVTAAAQTRSEASAGFDAAEMTATSDTATLPRLPALVDPDAPPAVVGAEDTTEPGRMWFGHETIEDALSATPTEESLPALPEPPSADGFVRDGDPAHHDRTSLIGRSLIARTWAECRVLPWRLYDPVGRVEAQAWLWQRVVDAESSPPVQGLLLQGAHGMGKTHTARWLARQLREHDKAHVLWCASDAATNTIQGLMLAFERVFGVERGDGLEEAALYQRAGAVLGADTRHEAMLELLSTHPEDRDDDGIDSDATADDYTTQQGASAAGARDGVEAVVTLLRTTTQKRAVERTRAWRQTSRALERNPEALQARLERVRQLLQVERREEALAAYASLLDLLNRKNRDDEITSSIQHLCRGQEAHEGACRWEVVVELVGIARARLQTLLPEPSWLDPAVTPLGDLLRDTRAASAQLGATTSVTSPPKPSEGVTSTIEQMARVLRALSESRPAVIVVDGLPSGDLAVLGELLREIQRVCAGSGRARVVWIVVPDKASQTGAVRDVLTETLGAQAAQSRAVGPLDHAQLGRLLERYGVLSPEARSQIADGAGGSPLEALTEAARVLAREQDARGADAARMWLDHQLWAHGEQAAEGGGSRNTGAVSSGEGGDAIQSTMSGQTSPEAASGRWLHRVEYIAHLARRTTASIRLLELAAMIGHAVPFRLLMLAWSAPVLSPLRRHADDLTEIWEMWLAHRILRQDSPRRGAFQSEALRSALVERVERQPDLLRAYHEAIRGAYRAMQLPQTPDQCHAFSKHLAALNQHQRALRYCVLAAQRFLERADLVKAHDAFVRCDALVSHLRGTLEPDLRRDVEAGHGRLALRLGDRAQARQRATALMHRGQHSGLMAHMASGALVLAQVALGEEDYATSSEQADKALGWFAMCDDVRGSAGALLVLLDGALRRRRWEDAGRYEAKLVAMARAKVLPPDADAMRLVLTGRAAGERGQLDAARKALDEALKACVASGHRTGQLAALEAMARWWACQGSWAEALGLLQRALVMSEAVGDVPMTAELRLRSASLMGVQDHAEHVGRLAADALRLGALTDQRGVASVAMLWLGWTCAKADRWDDAVVWVRKGLGALACVDRYGLELVWACHGHLSLPGVTQRLGAELYNGVVRTAARQWRDLGHEGRAEAIARRMV